MKVEKRWATRILLSLALLALVAVSPLAAADVIHNGADVWETVTGFTYSSFDRNPIPAGFFCPDSKAFAGKISLQGEPLKTAPAGSLGSIDTIVRRLDDAVLNEKGEARTRIQLLALSLASVKPIDTGCGLYNVSASLAGEQPVTEMKILRTSEGGGTYVAPLELNVKLVFTPVSGKGERRELVNRISLGPGSNSVWAYAKQAPHGVVRVDTNGDDSPDTVMPASSNFMAGVAPAQVQVTPGTAQPAYCRYQSCHCAVLSTNPYEPNDYCEHLHCVWVSVPCSQPVEPVRHGTATQVDGSGTATSGN
jgi:hypothetical protein